jgi:hypothetical protein
MEDAWLRQQENFFVISPMIPGMENMSVHDQSGFQEWNKNLIEGIFNIQREAFSILSIPLFECVQEDIHTWKFQSYGEYSVKSAISTFWKTWWIIENSGWKVIG